MKKQNLKRLKKAELTIQSIFYILMSIVMIWIIIFGIQKIFFVKDTISEQDKLIVKKQIKEALEYCTDPLNKGSYKSIPFTGQKYNLICFAGKVPLDENKFGTYLKSKINLSYGRNTFLIKTNIYFDKSNNEYKIIDPNKNSMILDSFNSDIGNLTNSVCMFKEFRIIC